MGSKPFLPHIEFLRAVAILFVIYTHVGWPLTAGVNLAIYTFFQNGTVFFVFISGYLFTFLNHQLKFANYLKKKLFFVVIPYIFLSLVFVWIQVLVFQSYDFNILNFLSMLSTGAMIQSQFWFIPMIVLFFLTAPVLHKMAFSKWGTLLLIVTLPLAIMTWRPYGQINPFYSYIHYFGIYHFGCVFGARREVLDKWFSKNSIIIASFLAFILSWVLEYVTYNATANSVFEDLFSGKWAGLDFSMIQKLALLCFIYGVSIRVIKKRYLIVKILAEYSFGIFFLHLFFINLVFMFMPSHDAIWACFLVGILSVIGSLVTVAVLKPFMNQKTRYLVGC